MTLDEARNINPRVVSVEVKYYKVSGKQYIYLTKCENCETILKIKVFKIHSGKCSSCSHKGKPFYAIYTKLKNDKRFPVEFSYEEFLEFTEIKKCHYCLDTILWSEYMRENGIFKTCAYFLDRKDSFQSYTVKNCVVCCYKCNKAKSNVYTYDEWYGMTEYFRNKL